MDALKQVQLQLTEVFAQDQQVLQERVRYQQFQQEQQLKQRERSTTTSSLEPTETPMPLGTNNSPSPLFNGSVSSLFGNVSRIVTPEDFAEMEKASKLTSIQTLFHSLNGAGLIFTPPKESIVTLFDKIDSTNKLNSKKAKNNNLPSISFLQDVVSNCKAYFATANVNILNTPTLQLSQQNIVNDNPVVTKSLIHLLYRNKPNKCSTCGKRFGNSIEERKLQTAHLDWHFRINKRIKGSSTTNAQTNAMTSQKNIQSRNWYLHDSQWVKFNDDEIVSTQNTFNENPKQTIADVDQQKYASGSNGSSTATNIQMSNFEDMLSLNKNDANNSTSETADLSKKYVIVPESTEDMTFQCPVCKDSVTSVYDEELGEWIWKNTVIINGKKFHSTCYYETIKNNSSL